MAEVGRRAGVGAATLYRNFAHRRALLEALYADEIDGICRAAGTPSAAAEEADPGAAVLAWLARFAGYVTSKRTVAVELLAHTDRDAPLFGAGRTRILDAGRPLLQAAQHAGAVRADLDLAQVLDMIAAIAKVPGDAAYREPMLRAVLDGLRGPSGGSPAGSGPG